MDCVCTVVSFSVFLDKKHVFKIIITTTTEDFNDG